MHLFRKWSLADACCILGSLFLIATVTIGYLVHAIHSDYQDRAADIDTIEVLGDEMQRWHELHPRSVPRQEHASRSGAKSGMRFPGDTGVLRPEEQAHRPAN